jgi:hypothetical protein
MHAGPFQEIAGDGHTPYPLSPSRYWNHEDSAKATLDLRAATTCGQDLENMGVKKALREPTARSQSLESAKRAVEGKVRCHTLVKRVPQHVGERPVCSRTGGPDFWSRRHQQKSGCLVLAFFARAGTTNVCSCEATPPDSRTKSSSSLHSPSPDRLRPEDKNDNCSTATPPVRRPVPASPDCDAYSAVSPRASSSSLR